MTSEMTGEVRCPSCARLTPLAPYCTHCGAVIPEGAGGPRPHAMDRQELEERARQLHGASSPFRRGLPAGDGASRVDAWAGSRAPEAFVPEPSDELARRAEPGPGEGDRRVDYFDERTVPPAEAQPAPPPPAAAVAPIAAGAAAFGSRGGGFRTADERTPSEGDADPYGGGYPPPDYADYGAGAGYGAGGGYGDPGWPPDEGPSRRSAALPVLGFVVLGIAALLAGAFLFSALKAPAGVAEQTSTPSPTASPAASETPNASATESGTPGASTAPSAAPSDNFTARAEPCATSEMNFDGCAKDGSTLRATQVWVWVGFKNGQASNVLGVTIVARSSGSAVGDGSLELDKLNGCDPGKTCSGYIQMTFGDLSPGTYTIQVTRDGAQVAATDFTISA
ncbi:MAG TPA: hypothetical protein VKU35_00575 [Candidatus Limnocylindria bacterium]|nr:hypothetical protein [Candidatus Limnocylindria bacterium]